MPEWLIELRENWGDTYWWLDHQIELAILVAIATGIISFTFKLLELWAAQALIGGTANV